MRISTLSIPALLIVVGACADDPTLGSARDGVPSFDEFKATWAHELDDGTWIVNGDEPIVDEDALLDFYLDVFGEGELIVNRVGGSDDRWTDAQVGNLTYCVSNTFGGSKNAIVSAVDAGGRLWENASSRINFVYVPSQDGNCNTRNNAVVFSVEPTNDPNLYARAFFPSYSKRKRNVLVNAANTLSNGDAFTASEILGHELGHALGFRHEHTRPESGTCFEDNNWRPLTPYDANSIMHYPWCNGGNGALSFSSTDSTGARALYGS